MAGLILLYLGALSIYDMREKSMPLGLLMAGIILFGILGVWSEGLSVTALGCVPGVMLLVLALAMPRSIGAGDGLAAMAVGAVYGFESCCRWLLLGFGMAAVVGLWRVVIGREDTYQQIALLPFLFAAAVGVSLL